MDSGSKTGACCPPGCDYNKQQGKPTVTIQVPVYRPRARCHKCTSGSNDTCQHQAQTNKPAAHAKRVPQATPPQQLEIIRQSPVALQNNNECIPYAKLGPVVVVTQKSVEDLPIEIITEEEPPAVVATTAQSIGSVLYGSLSAVPIDEIDDYPSHLNMSIDELDASFDLGRTTYAEHYLKEKRSSSLKTLNTEYSNKQMTGILILGYNDVSSLL
jgi:hypothetical protein